MPHQHFEMMNHQDTAVVRALWRVRAPIELNRSSFWNARRWRRRGASDCTTQYDIDFITWTNWATSSCSCSNCWLQRGKLQGAETYRGFLMFVEWNGGKTWYDTLPILKNDGFLVLHMNKWLPATTQLRQDEIFRRAPVESGSIPYLLRILLCCLLQTNIKVHASPGCPNFSLLFCCCFSLGSFSSVALPASIMLPSFLFV